MKKKLTFFVALVFVAVMALSLVAQAAETYCITCTKSKCAAFRPASGTKCVCGHDRGAHVGPR